MDSPFQQVILLQVAKEKLEDLNHQKTVLAEHYGPVLILPNESSDGKSKKYHLLEKLRKLCSTIETAPLKVSKDYSTLFGFENHQIFFNRADTDPTITSQMLEYWIGRLEKEIKLILLKCDYSFLFGSILTECLDQNRNQFPKSTELCLLKEKKSTEGKGETSQSEKDKMIQELSSRIFQPSQIDKESFKSFLNKLFFSDSSTEDNHDLIKEISEDSTNFGQRLKERTTVTADDIKQCIAGLFLEDFLSREKLLSLKEIKNNSDALEEIATLLTNRLRNINRWNWPSEVLVDVRRGIKGRYRAYMNEDAITALFLQFVGMKWSVHIRYQLQRIYDSKMWIRPHNLEGIEKIRQKYHSKVFLTSLPKTMESQGVAYDKDNIILDDSGNSNSKSTVQTSTDIKHELLHIISNEAKLNKVLHPEEPLTVVQTDLEWFGPSLSHDSILSTLEILGVPPLWIDFFQRFLETPIKFESESEVQIRKRGTPLSHSLSMLFGELMLFIMDFQVNKESGINLHRVHDDILFWGYRSKKVVKAWEVMKEYAEYVGLSFNMTKSGSVTTNGDSEIVFGDNRLPQNNVTSGFLNLHSDGVFRVDENALKPYIDELKRQLDKSTKVMEWIKVYNNYMKFFNRNFGKSSPIFGKFHINQINSALEKIHMEVFKDTEGDAVKALKGKFAIFSGVNLIDAWVYWPVDLGGLGLCNPMLEMIACLESLEYLKYKKEYNDLIKTDMIIWKNIEEAKQLLQEKSNGWEYQESKKQRFDENFYSRLKNIYIHEHYSNFVDLDQLLNSSQLDHEEQKQNIEKIAERIIAHSKLNSRNMWWKWLDLDPTSFDDFCKLRETKLKHWESHYESMLTVPPVHYPYYHMSNDLQTELQNFVYPDMKTCTDIDHWNFCRYGQQIKECFGTLQFVNTDLIPKSLIAYVRSTRLKY